MNVDRLIQTLNHIIQHPESWSQEQWHYCGTAHCFAGHGQINAGKEIDDKTCSQDAIEWYGLNREDAWWLFAVYRTLPEIYAFVKAVKGDDPYLYDNGYDRDGYDQFGFNRDGFNCNGFDRSGNTFPLL